MINACRARRGRHFLFSGENTRAMNARITILSRIDRPAWAEADALNEHPAIRELLSIRRAGGPPLQCVLKNIRPGQ